MEALLIWVVTCLYVGQAVVSTFTGHYPQAVMVAGFAFGNLGLIWSFK